MRLTHRSPFLSAALLLTVALSIATAQTLTSNKTGSQGGYIYEFWKDNGGSGTMILGDGGDFSCTWSGINNILFRKGLRPGEKNQTITFSATYNPSGNSYLSVYGWTKNPLVEYYIIESWGNWRPPGGSIKKTITVSGDKYDIYQTTRTNQPSIEGTKTFQQYWSVRQAKRTSGTIYCSEHFNAWADLGMTMGSMYEVSFVVEGYQSNGNADVKMSMTSGYPAGVVSGNNPSALSGATASIMHKRIEVTGSGNQTIDFTIPENRFGSLNLYNVLGQEIAPARKRDFPAGRHTVSFSDFNLSRGTYVYSVKQSR